MADALNSEHGGPDAWGVPRWDFSTNANACGPCPQAWTALAQADAQHYPDPAYSALRAALAAFHAVAVERIVVAASASEFISRISAWVARSGGGSVSLPVPAYGDYARAAGCWGLSTASAPTQAALVWHCEPSSPRGLADVGLAATPLSGVTVLDRAYEPLRLSGQPSVGRAVLERLWQIWSPNKALGLTGVRGAYAIAPIDSAAAAQSLMHMAPSWPLGAHAVAMLHAWVQPASQQWLAQSRQQLQDWKAQQCALLQSLGWQCLPSETPYFCAQAPQPLEAAALRRYGIKLRDTRSMGLPDHWRLSVQPPAAQAALGAALQALQRP